MCRPEDLCSIPESTLIPYLSLLEARSWKLTLTWPLPVFVNSPGKSPDGNSVGSPGGLDTDRGGRGRALTRRKARTAGTLLSSTNRRRAFSWLLQYSSYTQNLSFCKTRHRCEMQDTGRHRQMGLPGVLHRTQAQASR